MRLSLVEFPSEKKGVVVGIYGGVGFVKKLEAMGIRVGVSIEKISPNFLKGPVVVKIKNIQVAIGFGMAKRIVVESK